MFDELSAAGATFQNAIQPFHPPDLSIKEAFAELRVPMLRDRRLVRELTVEAAGRISDYNNSIGSVASMEPRRRLLAGFRARLAGQLTRHPFARRRRATCSGRYPRISPA